MLNLEGMNLEEAKAEIREYATDRGRTVASWIDTPPLGGRVWTEGGGERSIETQDDQIEYVKESAADAEQGNREFSPFEHTAAAIRDYAGEWVAEELWDIYDEAIAAGISKEVQRRFHSTER